MWRSNARQTGANEAPLAAPRRWGGGQGGQGANGGAQDMSGGYGAPGGGAYDDRGRGGYSSYGPGSHSNDSYRSGGYGGGHGSGGPPVLPSAPALPESTGVPGERKRKSRWGNEKVEGSAMPVAITGQLEGVELEKYAAQLRLDEITRALRSGQVVPPDGARSPSPPPTYDNYGRRTNTREVRYRKKLEDERMRLVERQMKLDPSFRPPTEYLVAKRQGSGRPMEKIYIPVKDYPEINFFGLLVGPRGNSLKKMERESGAKISIRGKGSVKEGKGRPGHEDDENEELHCVVTADTQDKVDKCIKLINQVIETAASTPETQNDHKRSQLRELAALNGTLRDDENQICQNCGGVGHRKYDCPEQKNWTAGIICRICGGAGHMARDCTQRRGGFGGPGGPGGPPGAAPAGGVAQQFDSEYASLMAELGETSAAPPVTAANGAGAPDQAGVPGSHGVQQPGAPGGHPVDANGQKIPPWRIPSNWRVHDANRDSQGYGGYDQYGGRGQGQYGPPGGGYDSQQQQGWPQQAAAGYGQQGGYGAPQQQGTGYQPQQSGYGGGAGYPGY
ncbi:hypothetical protein OIO90_001734 [Microbotryomycetes sp. JL221]|nr:hypothetical protein OIO90_001734 [Microbotryomycetes sp. JL221]